MDSSSSAVSTGVCTMCNSSSSASFPRIMACSRCHVTFYCSVDCQKKDWETHKFLCNPFSNFQVPPVPTHSAPAKLERFSQIKLMVKRGIFFSAEFQRPHWIWVPTYWFDKTKLTDHIYQAFRQTPTGSDYPISSEQMHEDVYQKLFSNWCSLGNSEYSTNPVRGRDLGHKLVFLQHIICPRGGVANTSIENLMTIEGRPNTARNNVLVMKMNDEKQEYIDMSPADFRNVVDVLDLFMQKCTVDPSVLENVFYLLFHKDHGAPLTYNVPLIGSGHFSRL